MSRKITIKDVARAAGVSVGSVSNVINGNHSVKEATATKVNAAMRNLGYRINATARSMRTRSTRAIGFVISDISNPIYAEISKEAERHLNKDGYHLILVDSDNRPGQEVEILSILNGGLVDAVVVTLSNETDPHILEALRTSDVPIVLLDRNVDLPLDSVCIDYAAGIEKSINYLSDLGHKDIALISSDEKIRPGRECIRGYRSALKQRAIPVNENLVRAGPPTADFAYRQAIDLLSNEENPTAIICCGNRFFAGVLRAINCVKIKVPSDLSIIAIDDTDLTSLVTPSFTVITRDTKALGKAVAETVIAVLEEGTDRIRNSVLIGVELLVRDSCSTIRK